MLCPTVTSSIINCKFVMKQPSNTKLFILRGRPEGCHLRLPLALSDSVNTFSDVICSTRPSEIWDNLEDIDNALALKFKWNKSMNHQKLLRSLDVDTQNVVSLNYVQNLACLTISQPKNHLFTTSFLLLPWNVKLICCLV